MTCPTITNLHAILAAYDAPAGPSKADTLKAVAECLSGACAPATFDLHAAIMNIPADHAKACGTNNAPAYKIGHRDARHAAAELAIQAQPVAAQGEQVVLIEIIEEWHDRLDNVVAANKIPMPPHITAQALCEVTERLRDEMAAILAAKGGAQ